MGHNRLRDSAIIFVYICITKKMLYFVDGGEKNN